MAQYREIAEFDGVRVPLTIHIEPRRNVHFSLTRKGGRLRLPALLPKGEQKKEIERFKQWVAHVIRSGGQMLEHYKEKEYRSGDLLTVGNRSYTLHIEGTASALHSGKIGEGHIYLFLTEDTPEGRRKAISHLLSRLVARDFYTEIALRVNELNDRHFQQHFNKICLKYNLSNWGSCSCKRNINLSTCVLFAPQSVIDYVIIHELSHLVEMNHSTRFWALVEEAMPGYQEKITWLKHNWSKCRF